MACKRVAILHLFVRWEFGHSLQARRRPYLRGQALANHGGRRNATMTEGNTIDGLLLASHKSHLLFLPGKHMHCPLGTSRRRAQPLLGVRSAHFIFRISPTQPRGRPGQNRRRRMVASCLQRLHELQTFRRVWTSGDKRLELRFSCCSSSCLRKLRQAKFVPLSRAAQIEIRRVSRFCLEWAYGRAGGRARKRVHH